MTDPNWTSPSGPGQDPNWPAQDSSAQPIPQPNPQPAPQQYVYAAIDPNQNWGVAVPPVAGYAMLVPRPPRPPIVRIATILAFVGVGVSLVLQTLNGIHEWTHRAQVMNALQTNQPVPADVQSTADTATTVGMFIGFGLWVLVAAGIVICTVLTVRKRNAARIVLAAAMGVLGLYQLCGVGSAAIVLAAGNSLASASPSSPFSTALASVEITWWMVAGQGLLAVIALIVFVSLIIPPANRYFTAGPGHRFAPEV